MIPVCIFLVGVSCSAATVMRPVAETKSETAKLEDAGDSVTDQEKAIASIVGTWEAKQFGHQVLTTRQDGTATIKMSLTPMAAVIYGRQVTLDLLWTLEGEVLTQHIIGGSPARSVEKLIAKFGDTQQFRVLETSPDQILVAKEKSESNPVCWTAVTLANR
jgi:hypothetical protein